MKLGDTLQIGDRTFQAVLSPCPGICRQAGAPRHCCDLEKFGLDIKSRGCHSPDAICLDHDFRRDQEGFYLHFVQIPARLARDPNPL